VPAVANKNAKKIREPECITLKVPASVAIELIDLAKASARLLIALLTFAAALAGLAASALKFFVGM